MFVLVAGGRADAELRPGISAGARGLARGLALPSRPLPFAMRLAVLQFIGLACLASQVSSQDDSLASTFFSGKCSSYGILIIRRLIMDQ